jgi:hypothetical protein
MPIKVEAAICPCKKRIDAYPEPLCFTEKDWINRKKFYEKNNCKIISAELAPLQKCICPNYNNNPQLSIL